MAGAQTKREDRQRKAMTYNKVTEFKARPSPLVSSLLLSHAHMHTHARATADIKISVPWPRRPSERTHCRLRYFPTLLPQGQEAPVSHAHTHAQ